MPAGNKRFSPFGSHPYRNMFACMVVVILAAVLLPETIIGGGLYDYMVAAILLVALLETASSRRHAVISLAVGVPAIGARLIAAHLPDSAAINSPILVLTAAFFAVLIWNLLRDLLVGSRPTSERVFGALTAYFCIGILFALFYAHTYFLQPESFVVPEHLSAVGDGSESQMVPVFTYFSFVTLTTLGYGDVLPISEQARTIAWFEALTGQLYLAVMVAGVVAAFVSETSREK